VDFPEPDGPERSKSAARFQRQWSFECFAPVRRNSHLRRDFRQAFVRTPKESGSKNPRKNFDLVLDESMCRVRPRLKQKLPESWRFSFCRRPARELERRLRGRGRDWTRKLRVAGKSPRRDCSLRKYYDYCVVNEDVERAGNEAQAIVVRTTLPERARSKRVEQLLASFGGKD